MFTRKYLDMLYLVTVLINFTVLRITKYKLSLSNVYDENWSVFALDQRPQMAGCLDHRQVGARQYT